MDNDVYFQVCKLLIQNIVYSTLHKKEYKYVDSAYSNLVRFLFFCVGRSTKYFVLRYCTLEVYLITSMYNFFRKFISSNIILNF
jgi:hypothetical protein